MPELAPVVFDELVDLGSADEYEREFRRWCDWLDELDTMGASRRREESPLKGLCPRERAFLSLPVQGLDVFTARLHR